jgi:hypothetical protein
VVPCTGLFYFTGKISTRGDGARPSYEIYKRLLKTYYNHKQKIITSKCSFQSRVYFRQRNNNPINFFLGITYYISDHPFGYRLNNGWNSWVSSEQYYNWSQRFGWVGPALSIDNSKKTCSVFHSHVYFTSAMFRSLLSSDCAGCQLRRYAVCKCWYCRLYSSLWCTKYQGKRMDLLQNYLYTLRTWGILYCLVFGVE